MAQQTAIEYFDEQIQERIIAKDTFTNNIIIEISFDDYMEIKKQAKQMEKKQTEISDEEIEKSIIDQDVVKQEGYCHCFLEGAKWYREQLKKKICYTYIL